MLPIEAVERLPHNFVALEGALEFRVAGVEVLTRESLPCGYIADWWTESLDAVADLLKLRSVVWRLPGKDCRVRVDVTPGTRQASVWAELAGGEPYSQAVSVRVPELTEAMLDEAERFFVWLNGKGWTDPQAALSRIGELLRAPAPWRR